MPPTRRKPAARKRGSDVATTTAPERLAAIALLLAEQAADPAREDGDLTNADIDEALARLNAVAAQANAKEGK
jgi:hypothetical protein